MSSGITFRVRKFKFLTGEDLLNLPDPEYLIEDIIDMDTLCMLYGPSGTGKSFVALSLAHAVSTGSDWMGHKCRKGKVLYICCEGLKGMKLRYKAIVKEQGEFGEAIFLGPIVDFFGTIDGELMASQLNDMEFNPDLIIVDTLARTFGEGRENETDQMNQYINNLDRMRNALGGCTVLLVHHTGKDTSRGARGSSSLPAAIDTSIECNAIDVGKEKNITLTSEKEKDLASFNPIKLHLRPVKLPDSRGSAAIFPGYGRIDFNDLVIDATPRLSDKKQTILKFFSLNPRPATRSECIAACKKPSEKSKGQYHNAIRDLSVEGLLKQIETGRNAHISISQMGLEVSLNLDLVSQNEYETAMSQVSSVPHPLGGTDSDNGDENDDDVVTDNAIIRPSDNDA